MNEKIANAVASAMYILRQQALQVADTDDKKIRSCGLFDEWAAGKHKAGEIYNAAGQTWECFQSYDNDIHPDITPGQPAWFTFNRPLHGRAKETAREFVAPQGAHDMYRVGEFAIFDSNVYECIADTAYSPADYAAAWQLAKDGGTV